MLRFIILLLACTCVVESTQAQTIRQRKDSLMAEVLAQQEDTNKVLLLCNISGNYFNLAPDSGIVFGKKALQLATKLNYSRGIAVANKAIARCYAIRDQYPEALKYFNTALTEARKISNHELEAAILLSLGNIYSNRGNLNYNSESDYDKALSYYLQAEKAYNLAGRSSSNVLRAIGGLYLHQAEEIVLTSVQRKALIDKALLSYKKGIQQEEKAERPSQTLAKLYDNAGGVYCRLEQYQEGLAYMSKSLAIKQQAGNERSVAYSLNNIGYTYFRATLSNCKTCPDSIRNKNVALPKVLRYLERSAEIAERLEIKYLLENVYANISEVYADMGNYKMSMQYYMQHVQVGDSLRNIGQEKRFAKVEAEFAVKKKTDSLKYANTIKDSEIAQRKTERNGTMAVLALVGITGFLFINRQNIKRKKLKAEKDLADTNLALADSKLKTAQQRLDNFTKNLKEKNQLIENFSVEIERLQALPCSNELPDSRENLLKLQNSNILTDEQWDDFRATFDEVHTGFLSKLREKMPDLTPAETRFVALTKLRMNNKEMASMLGVGDGAVRNYKYRLLKKLNLSAEADINEVVDSI